MKKKNILFIGLAFLGLSACSDYLEVESPSKVTDEYVFGNLDEANRVLNSVYAAIASGDTYGKAYLTTFCFNSDVEFTTSSQELQKADHSEFKLFDCESDASALLKTWNAVYTTVERANNFVTAAENSELYAEGDEDLLQMIGEAKCLRAMSYLDLVLLMGDIPFTFTRAYDKEEDLVMPIVNRDEILATLIEDLREAAPHMKLTQDIAEGVERCSKEYCWALIARIALFRGGYSLRPGSTPAEVGTMQRADDYKKYYEIASLYCDSVISAGTHSLTKDYYDVFIDECRFKVNNSDDPIFEIPFTQNVSGNIGAITGPKSEEAPAGGTEAPNLWGTAGGDMRLNAFYRFTFDEQDVRRNTVGFWYYTYNGTPTLFNDYNNYCNKWSKFWDNDHVLGNQNKENTGINFPYMRYADVLLMYAEAENEIHDGPTDAARRALKEVRERAFRNATNKGEMVDAYVERATGKEEFFQLIVDERAWEFGGENIRWKDLVRWNLYSKVVYETFWRYYGMGSDRDDTYDVDGMFDVYPDYVFYKVVDNPADGSYPNLTLPVLEFYTYEVDGVKVENLWQNFGLNVDKRPDASGSTDWTSAILFNWLDDNLGIAKAQCRCSLRGYIYVNEEGTLIPSGMPGYSESVNLSTLPPVRYILPIPDDAVARSKGTYKNYYGY